MNEQSNAHVLTNKKVSIKTIDNLMINGVVLDDSDIEFIEIETPKMTLKLSRDEIYLLDVIDD